MKKERQVSCTGEVIENVMWVEYRRGDGGDGDEYKDEEEKERGRSEEWDDLKM